MRFLLYLLFFNPIILIAQDNAEVPKSIASRTLPISIDSIPVYKKASKEAHSKGDFEDFRKYCQAILTIAKENNLKKLEAQALTNIGIYHSNVEELDAAIEAYIESSNLMQAFPEDKRSNLSILVNLGNLYNKIKDYDKATETMLEVIERSGSVADTDNFLMAAYIGLGTAAKNKKDFKQSIAYNTKAKDIAIALNRKDVITSSLLNLSVDYLLLKEYDKVIDNCKSILADLTEEDSKKQKAKALFALGDAQFQKGQLQEARYNLEQSITVASNINLFSVKMNAHKILAKVYEMEGNLQKSLKEQKNYTEAREAYLNTLSKAQRLELEIASNEKTALLSEQSEALKRSAKEKWLFIISGSILSIALVGTVFYFRRRKDKLVEESTQLKEDSLLLRNENEVLKDKLKSIASDIKKEQITKKTASYQNSSLTAEDQEKYMQQILDFMELQKPYLNPEIKQSIIAKKLSMTVHLFSEILNVCFHQNFNSFINLYRVSEAKALMSNPKYKEYKILAIGYEAGFSSKTSFNRVFKNLVGCTPSEFQKQHK